MVRTVVIALAAMGCTPVSNRSVAPDADRIDAATPDARIPLDAFVVDARAVAFSRALAEPLIVPSGTAGVVSVPLIAGPTGGFLVYAAGISDQLAAGDIRNAFRTFDADGAPLGGGAGATVYDPRQPPPDDGSYGIAGGCLAGNFGGIDPRGPVRMELTTTDHLGRTAIAELWIAPTCDLAGGWSDPDGPTAAQACRAECPGL